MELSTEELNLINTLSNKKLSGSTEKEQQQCLEVATNIRNKNMPNMIKAAMPSKDNKTEGEIAEIITKYNSGAKSTCKEFVRSVRAIIAFFYFKKDFEDLKIKQQQLGKVLALQKGKIPNYENINESFGLDLTRQEITTITAEGSSYKINVDGKDEQLIGLAQFRASKNLYMKTIASLGLTETAQLYSNAINEAAADKIIVTEEGLFNNIKLGDVLRFIPPY